MAEIDIGNYTIRDNGDGTFDIVDTSSGESITVSGNDLQNIDVINSESSNTDTINITQSYTDPTGYTQSRKIVGAKAIPTPTAYFAGPAHGEGSSAFRGATLSPNGRVIFAPANSSNVGITSLLQEFAIASSSKR